jgi:hypothetical protein
MSSRNMIWLLAALVTLVSSVPAFAEEWCRYGALPLPGEARQNMSTAPATAHTLAVYYAVPSDIPVKPAVRRRIISATLDILAWYQCASGGVAWQLAFPETVRVYNGIQTRQYYKDNGDWWGSLPGEMGAYGEPIWTPGTITAIWAHGAGWWAGAAQWCGVECGTALLGVEIFPEFNNPAWSGGTCPGGGGVAAWPCTPEGAYAHELGHTLGLPHPAGVPATAPVASHSIMQTHWNYPRYAPSSEKPWGFLTLERQTILANPFMFWNVPVNQTHADCNVVNLPSTGAPPVAAFTRNGSTPPSVFTATNTSTGAAYSYWTFGDGAASGNANPSHTYTAIGNYLVLLRAMASNAMMDTAAAPVAVPTLDVPLSSEPQAWRVWSQPNPCRTMATVHYAVGQAGVVDLSVFDAQGRQVATLARGFRPAGVYATVWSARDRDGTPLPHGLYLARLRVAGRHVTGKLVVSD